MDILAIENDILLKFELMPLHQETYFEYTSANLEINNIKYYQCNNASEPDIKCHFSQFTLRFSTKWNSVWSQIIY